MELIALTRRVAEATGVDSMSAFGEPSLSAFPSNVFTGRHARAMSAAGGSRHRTENAACPANDFGETPSQKKASLSFCIALRHIQSDWLLV
jgi:hypothetical protein